MRVLSIIPVKDLRQTKTRLSSILDLQGRQNLTLQLLYRTIRILKCSEKVDRILVLTPDHKVLTLAGNCGALPFREKEKGLNESLREATLWAIASNFDALLILPSDIPYVGTDDIEAIICMGRKEGNRVVISPDLKESGTNALFIKPPGVLGYHFGIDSFDRHRNQALNHGIQWKVYRSASIGFDLDTPEQYHSLVKKKHFVEEIKYRGNIPCFSDPHHRNTLHQTER